MRQIVSGKESRDNVSLSASFQRPKRKARRGSHPMATTLLSTFCRRNSKGGNRYVKNHTNKGRATRKRSTIASRSHLADAPAVDTSI